MQSFKSYATFCLAWLLLLTQTSCLAAFPAEVDGKPMPTLAPILEKVTPAVVNISTRTRVAQSSLFDDPVFRFFFEAPRSDKPNNQSLGSGVVIDANRGLVVTNHHVIEQADEIEVTLRDGRRLDATLVGTDSETDVALLRVPPTALIDVKLGDSDKLRVGDFVLAIGNPFGLGQTVTSGIVSALGRSGLGIEGYEDFIQTDASINPGNSGGALINLRGELVGINTAILAPSGGNVGIGFAIPINMANQIVKQLIDYGEVQRGILGISIQDLTPDLAAAFGLDSTRGALVMKVVKSSAAEQAGILTGDVITFINGKRVDNAADARNHIGLLRVGEKITLTIIREGRRLNLEAKIGNANQVSVRGVEGQQVSSYLKGTFLTQDQRQVVVFDVDEYSPAWRGGLREGDVIIRANGHPVESINELGTIFQKYRPPYLLQIHRGNQLISFLLR